MRMELFMRENGMEVFNRLVICLILNYLIDKKEGFG